MGTRIFCFCIVFVLLLAGSASAFANDEYGISFDDPEGWDVDFEDFYGSGGLITCTDPESGFSIKGHIYQTAAQVLQTGSSDLPDIASYLKENYRESGGSILSESYTKINGHYFYEVVAEGSEYHGDKNMLKSYTCMGEDYVYTLDIYAESTNYNKILPVLNNLAYSVQFDFEPVPLPQTLSEVEIIDKSICRCDESCTVKANEYGINYAGKGISEENCLPAWLSGQSGSAKLEASGGTEPYEWYLKSGEKMPPGLSLSTDCTISGVAETLPESTNANVYPEFTVVVWDSSNPRCCDETDIHITVMKPEEEIVTNPEEEKGNGIFDAVSNFFMGLFAGFIGGDDQEETNGVTSSGTSSQTASVTPSKSSSGKDLYDGEYSGSFTMNGGYDDILVQISLDQNNDKLSGVLVWFYEFVGNSVEANIREGNAYESKIYNGEISQNTGGGNTIEFYAIIPVIKTYPDGPFERKVYFTLIDEDGTGLELTGDFVDELKDDDFFDPVRCDGEFTLTKS